MERKIGEIFEFNGEWYQCVESQDGSCKHCDMNFEGKCPIPIKECTESGRSDKSYVIFKKLEKVGDPFIGKVHIQLQRYKIYAEPIVDSTENIGYVNEENTIAIEIKETKEDMEEKKLNLKPFDIQKAREGKPVWHDVKEKPNGMFVILIDFGTRFGAEEYSFGMTSEHLEGAIRWAYVADLLPDKKEVRS